MRNAAIEGKHDHGKYQTGIRENQYLNFARYAFVATLVVACVVLLLYLVWYAADLLLLVFAGVLVSILLRGLGGFVQEKTGLGYGASLALTALVLLSLIGAAILSTAERVGTQIVEFQNALPQAVQSVQNYLGQYEWARQVIAVLPNLNDWLAERSSTIVTRITGLATSALGAILNTIIVFIIGLYLASQPEVYSRGIKHLIPFRFRERTGEILDTLDKGLWRWLNGRFLLMIANGILTGLGLWLLGVPLALTLGLLAGLLNFIPNFGPWIAGIPAVLIAFLQSPQLALYVIVLYVVLQALDGYVFTPLVDRKSVELPPVITITAQILLGFAFGFLGLLLASPLTAMLLILIKMLYIEEVIGDPVMENSNLNGEREKNDDSIPEDVSSA